MMNDNRLRLLIARHGNTFEKDEIPRRVGCKTDLPLTEVGKSQARSLGQFIAKYYPDLAGVYTSELQRTYEMAAIALAEAQLNLPVVHLAMLNEIDYGIDENKPEPEVVARIGERALKAWDENNIVPPGWNAQPQLIAEDWQKFAAMITTQFQNKNILVITSNGIARFALSLLSDEEKSQKITAMKMATGAVSSLVYQQGKWSLEFWNRKA